MEDSDLKEYYNGICQHIASLADQVVSIGTNEEWEHSDPFCIGGPIGLYTCKSPFIGISQWKVDIASAGASQSQVVVSSSSHQTGVDYTGSAGGFTENSGYDGLVINIPANSTIPVDSEWYSCRNSDGTLKVLVSLSANAAFVNIAFRQKRGVK